MDSLYVGVWNELSIEEQKKYIDKIARYYVSPLSNISEISAIGYTFLNDKQIGWQFIIDGLKYIFVPGCVDYSAGYSMSELMNANTGLLQREDDPDYCLKLCQAFCPSDPTEKHINPMLVSLDAIPINTIPVGYFKLDDGSYSVEEKLVGNFKGELDTLSKKQQETAHFILKENFFGNESQILRKSGILPGKLIEEYGKKGVSFISSDEYFYVKSGAENTFFPWGEVLDTDAADQLFYLPNKFGIRIDSKDYRCLMTDNPFRYMEGKSISEDPITKYFKYSSYFDTGYVLPIDYFDRPSERWNLLYRPVIRIIID